MLSSCSRLLHATKYHHRCASSRSEANHSLCLLPPLPPSHPPLPPYFSPSSLPRDILYLRICTSSPLRANVKTGGLYKPTTSLKSTSSPCTPFIETTKTPRRCYTTTPRVDDGFEENNTSIKAEMARNVVFNDLRRPHEWYPIARSMKRKIVMHVGPTNSGKTHTALEALKKAEGGVYCGPLRLLAEQVFEKLNTEGVPCNLMTGEKVIELDRVDEKTRRGLAQGGDEAMASLYELYMEESGGGGNMLLERLSHEEAQGKKKKESEEGEGGDEGNGQLPSSQNPLSPLSSASSPPPYPSSTSSTSPSPPPSPVNHVSCTIEMADVSRRVKVALIDEYQMMGDETRGWAWTRALLGMPAEELHLCGDLSSIELVKALLKPTGDEVEVVEYERLSPLVVSSRSLGRGGGGLGGGGFKESRPAQHSRRNVSNSTSHSPHSSPPLHTPFLNHHKTQLLPPPLQWIGNLSDGDAVIVFSRMAVFQHKRLIESTLGRKVSVVYGSLPPETRTQQARQFNDPDSETNILVATDAIGLGLNLNIGRIVFSTIKKFDGVEKRELRAPEIRQIGGRAGRFNSRFPVGSVTTVHPRDLPPIAEAFKKPIEHQTKAGLLPMFEHLELFEEALRQAIEREEEEVEMKRRVKMERKEKKRREQLHKIGEKAKKRQDRLEQTSVAPHSPITHTPETHPSQFTSTPHLTQELPFGDASVHHKDDIFSFNSLDVSPELHQHNSPSSSSPASQLVTPFAREEPMYGVDPKEKSSKSSSLKLGDILHSYEQVADLSGRFFLCNIDAHRTLCGAVDHLELTLKEKYTFVLAPTKANDPLHIHFLASFATDFSKGVDVICPSIRGMVAEAKRIERTATEKQKAVMMPFLDHVRSKRREENGDEESEDHEGGRDGLSEEVGGRKRELKGKQKNTPSYSSSSSLASSATRSSLSSALEEVEEWILSSRHSGGNLGDLGDLGELGHPLPSSLSAGDSKDREPPIVADIPMQRWEQMYRIVDLYIWLSYRFEGFNDVLTALKTKVVIEANIASLLDTMPSPYHLGGGGGRRRMLEDAESLERGFGGRRGGGNASRGGASRIGDSVPSRFKQRGRKSGRGGGRGIGLEEEEEWRTMTMRSSDGSKRRSNRSRGSSNDADDAQEEEYRKWQSWNARGQDQQSSSSSPTSPKKKKGKRATTASSGKPKHSKSSSKSRKGSSSRSVLAGLRRHYSTSGASDTHLTPL